MNRHIPVQWYSMKPPRGRVNTLCGSKSKYVGVPGIIEQPHLVDTPGGLKFGWCIKCLLQWWDESGHAINEFPPAYAELVKVGARDVAGLYSFIKYVGEIPDRYRPR